MTPSGRDSVGFAGAHGLLVRIVGGVAVLCSSGGGCGGFYFAGVCTLAGISFGLCGVLVLIFAQRGAY